MHWESELRTAGERCQRAVLESGPEGRWVQTWWEEWACFFVVSGGAVNLKTWGADDDLVAFNCVGEEGVFVCEVGEILFVDGLYDRCAACLAAAASDFFVKDLCDGV
jgi:hypothetical protein